MTINHVLVPDFDIDTPMQCMHTCIRAYVHSLVFKYPFIAVNHPFFNIQPWEISISPSILEYPTIHLVIDFSISWSKPQRPPGVSGRSEKRSEAWMAVGWARIYNATNEIHKYT